MYICIFMSYIHTLCSHVTRTQNEAKRNEKKKGRNEKKEEEEKREGESSLNKLTRKRGCVFTMLFTFEISSVSLLVTTGTRFWLPLLSLVLTSPVLSFIYRRWDQF